MRMARDKALVQNRSGEEEFSEEEEYESLGTRANRGGGGGGKSRGGSSTYKRKRSLFDYDEDDDYYGESIKKMSNLFNDATSEEEELTDGKGEEDPFIVSNKGKIIQDNARVWPGCLSDGGEEDEIEEFERRSIKSPSEDCSLECQSSVLMERNKGVGLSSKNFEEQSKECEKLVIGWFFAGGKASFSTVQEAIKKLWKSKSEVTISIRGDNAFVFNFVNEEERRVALEHGAFYIAGKLFVVKPWTPLIEQSIAEMKTTPVWILIYKVPLHLWNKLGLSSIATFIGNPLMMDEDTKKKTRLTYARVCVEINSDCTFPSLIPLWIDGIHIMDLPVKYQCKPSKCTKCACFGHNASSCSVTGVKKNPIR